MSESRSTLSRPSWRLAAALAVVAVILGVLLLTVVRPAANRRHGAAAGFSAAENAALKAATVQAVDLLTYTRKDFTADFARAIAGTTGALRKDLTGEKGTMLGQMTKNAYDLKATVSDTALVSGSGDKYLVMVVASGYRVDNKGVQSVAIPNRIELTMVKVGGKWLASDLQGIDLS